MSKWLLTADWHIGDSSLLDSVVGPGLYRKKRKILQSLVDWSVRNKITDFAILGDIFNKPSPKIEHVSDFIGIVRSLVFRGIEVHIIAGNHDVSDSDGVRSILSVLREAFGILENNDKIMISTNLSSVYNNKVIKCPWGYDGFHKNADLYLGHSSFNGFKMSDGYICEDSETDAKHFKSRHKGVKQFVFGHFHIPQTRGNFHYCGSPYPITFNETEHEKRVLVYENGKISSYELRHILGQYIRFIDFDYYKDVYCASPSYKKKFNSVDHNTIIRLKSRNIDYGLAYDSIVEALSKKAFFVYPVTVRTDDDNVELKTVSSELNENSILSGLKEYVTASYSPKLSRIAARVIRRAESDISEIYRDK